MIRNVRVAEALDVFTARSNIRQVRGVFFVTLRTRSVSMARTLYSTPTRSSKDAAAISEHLATSTFVQGHRLLALT